jgi:hypothetical protein
MDRQYECETCGKIFIDSEKLKGIYKLNRHKKNCHEFSPKHLISKINEGMVDMGKKDLKIILQMVNQLQ